MVFLAALQPVSATSSGTIKQVASAFTAEDQVNLDANIQVTLDGLNNKLKNEEIKSLILYINDIPFENIGAPHLAEENVLTFKLNRAAILKETYQPFSRSRDVTVEVGTKENVLYTAEKNNFTLIYYNHITLIIAFILGLLLLLFFVFSAIKTDLIKRKTMGEDKKPYSLSRTLIGFWTLIVSSSILFLTIMRGQIPNISPQILLLIGISASPSLISSLFKQKKEQPLNPPSNLISKGFLTDILRDADGTTTIQRFQAVAFHLIFGFIFLLNLFKSLAMTDFSPTQFLLLGISNGIYITGKFTRNYVKKDNTLKS